MQFDVFISYAHDDKVAADAVCATLERAGIRCWIAPRDVAPGAEWAAAIVDAIDRSRAMVLVFSSRANYSQQILREVQRAFDRGVSVVPFRIEDVGPAKSLAYYMGPVHWLDALTPPFEAHLEKLVVSIGGFLQKTIDSVPTRTETSVPESRTVKRHDPVAAAVEAAEWGAQCIRLNKYSQAILAYDEAIRLDPEYADAFTGRGYAYWNRDEHDRAIEDYDVAIRLDPGNSDAFEGRGKCYISKRDYDRAIQELDEAVRLKPSFGPLYWRARAYHQKADEVTRRNWNPESDRHKGLDREDYDRAIRDYDEILRKDPEVLFVLRDRMRAYSSRRREGDRERAIQDADSLIRIDPKKGETYFERSQLYHIDDHDRALRDIDEAIRLDPKNAAQYYDERARICSRKQDYDGAIHSYSESYRLAPSPWTLIMRGHTYREYGDVDSAIADYGEAIRLEPKQMRFYLERADARLAKHDYDGAIDDFCEVIRLNPDKVDCYRGRGDAYFANGDYGKAILDYDELFKRIPAYKRDAEVYKKRGQALLKRKEYQRALDDFNESIRLDPQNADAEGMREKLELIRSRLAG